MTWRLRFVGPPVTTAQGLTIDKVSECVTVVLAIIVLTELVGDDLGSIFLKKGDLKEGLRFGLISFGIFAALFAVIAMLQANAPASQGLTASGVSLAVTGFGIPHAGATYISPLEMIIFPIIVFGLGVVNARVMLKTDSIVGSLLFHAGYDLLVVIPVIVSG